MSQKRNLTIARIATYAVLVFAALLTLVPFVYLLTASLKSTGDSFSSTFLPAGDGLFGIGWERLTLANFKHLLFDMEPSFTRHILNGGCHLRS